MVRKNKSVHNSNKKIVNKEAVLIDQLMQKCLEYSTKSNQNNDELSNEFFTLKSLVDQIRKLQKLETEKILPKKERSTRINQFMNWCKKQNLIDEQKIEFYAIDRQSKQNEKSNQSEQSIQDNETDKQLEKQFGLRALVDINENDLMISIQRKFMLTNEDALKDKCFGPLIKEDSILGTMPNVCLSVYVIEQKCIGSDSFWKFFLEACPLTYSTTLFFDQKELELLKPSPSFELSIKMFRNICRQYAYFYQKMSNPLSKFSKLTCSKHFTFDLYRWAISLVMTRQNFIPSADDENQMIDALIPLYDMLNHEQGKLSTDFDVGKDEAICYAMKNFKAGQEVKIYYGNRSNAELLIYSGFVYEHNQTDYLIIKLGINKNDLLFKQKASLLDKLNIPKSGSFKLVHKNNPINYEMLAFLRVFHLDQNELDHYLQSNQELDNLFKMECKQFEVIDKRIKEFISTRARLMLRNYSIVNEEQPRTQNESNALLLLSLEKKILESYL